MLTGIISSIADEFSLSHDELDIITFLSEQNIPEECIRMLCYDNRITNKSLYDLASERHVSEESLLEYIAKSKGITFLDLEKNDFSINFRIVREIGMDILAKNIIVPITCNGKDYLASNNFKRDEYERISRIINSMSILPAICSKSHILDMLSTIDDRSTTLAEFSRELLSPIDYVDDYAIKFWDVLINEAISKKASDVHISPSQNNILVRFRIHGIMNDMCVFHTRYLESIAVRIKVMSRMNISEQRKPQDGSMKILIKYKEFDCRVSTHPTIHGESIVIRIFRENISLCKLDNLGYNEDTLECIRRTIKKKFGMTIVCGPTGSGKTTLIYSMLQNFSKNYSIMTLEEPVERNIKGIIQTNIGADFTYTDGIRSAMRQDPDVIVIGEIRDKLAAEAAITSSMTGHHIVTCMHTYSATEVFNRFQDYGIPKNLMINNLNMIIAQQLIRVLCDHCKQKYKITSTEMRLFNITEDIYLYSPVGCNECRDGYSGRRVVCEYIHIDEDLISFVERNPIHEISDFLRVKKFKTLRQAVIDYIKEGITSSEEAETIIR